MRPVDLNFATTPFINKTPYHIGYGLGALVIAGFTAYNAYAYMTYSKNQAELESDYAQKRTRLESLYEQSGRLQELIAKQDFAALNERAAFTNTMLESRRFSWTALLNTLEEVQPYQVRLLSLRPIVSPKSIVVEARAVARDLKSYWTFQQNLQNDPHFRRVYPGGYLKNVEMGEIIFNIAFSYFPQGMPSDFVGLTQEEIDALRIVDAPGQSGGRGEVADEDLPALEEEEPPPRAQKPAAPDVRSPAAPGGRMKAERPAAPPTRAGDEAVARGDQPDARGASGSPSGPPTAAKPPQAAANPGAMGAFPPGYVPPPSPDPNAARSPVRLKLPERGATPGSGGVRNPPPPIKQPDPALPMAPPVEDEKAEEGDDTGGGNR